MNDELELEPLKSTLDNNNDPGDQGTQCSQGISGNGFCTIQVGTEEVSNLLPTPQAAENIRSQHVVDGVKGDVHSNSQTETSKWRRELQSLKTDMNEVVVWKLKLWMVILLVLSAIALVITISLIVCAVSDDDGDDNYDKSSFVVKRFFRGNFTVDYSSFTLDQETRQLEQQLKDVYSSSPALERYFSNVTIHHLQDTTAQFTLQFMMPLDHEELVRYTLSLKMVKNVLLQHLYDQDTGDSFYIIPASLSMEVG